MVWEITGFRLAGALVVGWVLVVVFGCDRERKLPAKQTIQVAVSIAPQAWLVEQIGGDHISITTLVPAGQSPETFQPADVQVSQLMRADVYFPIGMPFERSPWCDAVRTSGKLRIVDMQADVPLRVMGHHDHHHEDDHGHGAHGHQALSGNESDHTDPHIWLSPQRLAIQARTVARALTELDPQRGLAYQRNCEQFEAHLAEVDRDIRHIMERLENRAFFVFHPAWGYFAEDYGLEQYAIETEGKEPSDHDLTLLQHQAKRLGIKVVFVQPQVSSRSATAVAKAIGGRVEVLDPLAVDVSANLVRVAQAIAQTSP